MYTKILSISICYFVCVVHFAYSLVTAVKFISTSLSTCIIIKWNVCSKLVSMQSCVFFFFYQKATGYILKIRLYRTIYKHRIIHKPYFCQTDVCVSVLLFFVKRLPNTGSNCRRISKCCLVKKGLVLHTVLPIYKFYTMFACVCSLSVYFSSEKRFQLYKCHCTVNWMSHFRNLYFNVSVQVRSSRFWERASKEKDREIFVSYLWISYLFVIFLAA